MVLSILDNVLWAAGFVGHVALFMVLLLRKRLRTFPVLSCFIAYEALRTIALYLIFHYESAAAYKLTYWTSGYGSYVLQVGVILEIAWDVLRPAGHWIGEARRAFYTWGVVFAVAAAALAYGIGAPESKGLSLWDARVTVFTSLLTCVLFVAMLMAANRLGLQQRSHILGLGRGLTTWACTALLGDLGHVAFGWQRRFVIFDHISEGVYVAVLVYWIMLFWKPEKQRELTTEQQKRLLELGSRLEYDVSQLKDRQDELRRSVRGS